VSRSPNNILFRGNSIVAIGVSLEGRGAKRRSNVSFVSATEFEQMVLMPQISERVWLLHIRAGNNRSLFSNRRQVLKYTIQSLFFLVLLVIGLCIYRDYGISWDEPTQRQSGQVTLKYVAERLAPSLLKGSAYYLESLNNYRDRDYGIAFEAPAVAFEKMLGLGDKKKVFMFRHLLTFLVALAGIFAVHKMVERRFSDWRVGLLAALFLILTPRIFAESFYNSKDIVLMAVFAIAMNTMITFVLNPSLRSAVLHGLASAVAIDVRIPAVILPIATAIILIIRLLKRESPISSTYRALAVYLATACILVLVMWPWLWSDPIRNFVDGFRDMANFRWYGEVLYMGRFFRGSDLPWHYIPVWITITTPLLYVALFLVGAFSTLCQIASRGTSLWRGDEELQDAVFLGLLVVPIATVIFLDSVVHDGWRHLYFIYPAFLFLAVRGWVLLWGKEVSLWGKDLGTIRKLTLVVVTAISVVHIAAWMWKVHPFQNVYFNTLAGSDLRSRYQLDYWGLADRKALEYILDNDKSEVIYVRADSWTPLSVAFNMIDEQDRRRLRLSDGDRGLARYALTNYQGVKDPDDAKYAKDYDLFYQIQVDNEIILSVFQRKESSSRFGRR
jgi:hypothetical protein